MSASASRPGRRAGGSCWDCGRLSCGSAPRRAAPGRGRVVLGLGRAELRIGPATGGALARVWVWEPLGRYGILTVRLGDDLVRLKVERGRSFQPGDAVTLHPG